MLETALADNLRGTSGPDIAQFYSPAHAMKQERSQGGLGELTAPAIRRRKASTTRRCPEPRVAREQCRVIAFPDA